MRVAVTGANGFVGRAVLAALQGQGLKPVPITRRACGLPGERTVGSISGDTRWAPAIADCDAVIHLAARVHVMRDLVADPLAEYRAVNFDGVVSLARQSVDLGIKRFVFVSSAKVLGEFSAPGEAFSSDATLNPCDPYAISKAEAETALQALAAEEGLELVIVRPPLVYGPGVGGNFLSMMQYLQRGVPMPLGALDNRRSLVGVENLADLLVTCTMHPEAAGKIFHATDGEDISTTQLLRLIAEFMGRPARLIPVPAALLAGALRLLGASKLEQRLCADFRLDGHATQTILSWRPPVGLQQGLRKTVVAFIQPTPGEWDAYLKR